ncbi:MAG: ABC transporter permease [Hyphomicrobiaceae bacterium]
MWPELIIMACEAIARNAMRSALTALGVLIGIASVIAMVSIGKGAAERVRGEIARLGSDLLTVSVGQSMRGGKGTSIKAQAFDYADVEALRREITGIRHLAPASSKPLRAVARNVNWAATVVGTETQYFAARGWRLAQGRSFTEFEMYNGRPVCILGTTVARRLYGRVDVVGEALRVGPLPCAVVGVLAERGQSGNDDADNIIAIPFDAFQRRVQGSPDITSIVIAAYPGTDMAHLKMRVVGLMRERRGLRLGEENDFSILDLRDVARSMTTATETLTLFLAAIAAVSLLVGGIGIMNIMLVSVAERTKEIGTRLAIGAAPSQIRRQFLIEAVLLTGLGGILGIAVGLAAAAIIAPAMGLPWVIDPSVVVLAVAISVCLGVGFGYAPASRAARLDPVEALRHD